MMQPAWGQHLPHHEMDFPAAQNVVVKVWAQDDQDHQRL